jgi:hypothetical protein
MNWLLWALQVITVIKSTVQQDGELNGRGGRLKKGLRARGWQMRCRMLLIHEKAFIKVSTLWNEHLPGEGIVELPALVALGISNEDALLHVHSKVPKWSLVPLDQDISSAAPNAQVREIWLAAIECLIRSGSLKRSGGHPIADMDEWGHGFTPKGGRHARLIEQRDDTLFNRPISPLCYTILLRPIPDCVLSLDAMINAECLKLSRHVFSTLIIAQGAHPFASESLSPCLELLEGSKGFRLALQEIDCLEAREVINEGHPVAIALVSGHLDRAMHIAVDKLKGPRGSCGGRGKGVCMHLSSFAGFTYWIRFSFWIKPETSHQVAWQELSDACQVVMAKATMQKGQIHGESGCGWERGELFNRNSVSNEICSIWWWDLRLKDSLAIPDEVKGVQHNGDREMAMHCEV